MLDSGLETLVLRALAFEAAEEEFEARRIYFHNGVVTIVLWFVLVPKECAAVVVEPSGGQKEPLKMTLSTSDLLSSTVIVRDHHGLINECLTDTKCLPN